MHVRPYSYEQVTIYPPSPDVKLFTNASSSNFFVSSSCIFLCLLCIYSVIYPLFKFILPQIWQEKNNDVKDAAASKPMLKITTDTFSKQKLI